MRNYTGECNEAKQSKTMLEAQGVFVLAEVHMLKSSARATYLTWHYKAPSRRVWVM